MLVSVASLSRRQVASVMPRTFELMVSPERLAVNSRTTTKTGSSGRSVFSNCWPAQRIDAIVFRYILITSLYLSLELGVCLSLTPHRKNAPKIVNTIIHLQLQSRLACLEFG